MHDQVNNNHHHKNDDDDENSISDNEKPLLTKSLENVASYTCHEQNSADKIPEVKYNETNISQKTQLQNNDNNDQSSSKETSLLIALQIFFPFIVAGFGTVFAGSLLDYVQNWKIFKEIPEVYILVPALLGLKGNLEMTLASRLSTAANVGKMECPKRKWSIIFGNMALTQAQALVVAVLASLLAVTLGWIKSDQFSLHHGFLLCACSLVTASITSALLGTLMVAVVIFSRRCGINPDNVATPIAASLGDLITLALLSVTSNSLYKIMDSHQWVSPLICGLFLLILPLWFYISHHNSYTHHILYSGWWPVILAMIISSAGGVILSNVVPNSPEIAAFSPVINGVGGNLVAVQASRLSTNLHRSSELGTLPEGIKYGFVATFCACSVLSKTSRVLLAMCIPGHIIFLVLLSHLNTTSTHPTYVFMCFYLLACFIQVGILLFICNICVHFLWKKKHDPDNCAIPFLTAIGDLFGTALLTGAFKLSKAKK
ncbi:solute carrier family 41 member 1 isoform X2 [Hydra vulgaris]|uniref:solute carrier family 41 member 1 isoform X2 n=1 Tax=Hydra vulgaris TaxID=6087 RepID=UPI0032EA6DAA